MLFVAGWDRYVTIYDDFFCQSACQRYGKYIDLNGFLRPQLHAFHWHIQLPLPPPSSLPGKRRSPGFLMGKHSAGIKHENTQISVEWQDFERRMLGFLTELSLQFFSIKIAAAKWSRGRTQSNNESHKEPEDKGLDWFADSKDEHVLLQILWKCLLGRTGIKENKVKEVLSWPAKNFWGWPSLFRAPSWHPHPSYRNRKPSLECFWSVSFSLCTKTARSPASTRIGRNSCLCCKANTISLKTEPILF